MIGTSTPMSPRRRLISGTAAADASLLTVTRTSCEPARASAATCSAVLAASAVSVFVIDCTTIGAPEPTGTPPTLAVTVCLRCPNFTDQILEGPSKAIARVLRTGYGLRSFPSPACTVHAFCGVGVGQGGRSQRSDDGRQFGISQARLRYPGRRGHAWGSATPQATLAEKRGA